MPHGRAGPESGAEAPREDCEMKCDRQYRFGDMILSYYLDEDMGTVNRIVWRRYEAGRL